MSMSMSICISRVPTYVPSPRTCGIAVRSALWEARHTSSHFSALVLACVRYRCASLGMCVLSTESVLLYVRYSCTARRLVLALLRYIVRQYLSYDRCLYSCCRCTRTVITSRCSTTPLCTLCRVRSRVSWGLVAHRRLILFCWHMAMRRTATTAVSTKYCMLVPCVDHSRKGGRRRVRLLTQHSRDSLVTLQHGAATRVPVQATAVRDTVPARRLCLCDLRVRPLRRFTIVSCRLVYVV